MVANVQKLTVVTMHGDRYLDVVDPDRRVRNLAESCWREADEYISEGGAGGLSTKQQWEQNGHRFLGNHWHTTSGGSAGLVQGFRMIQFSDSDSSGGNGIKTLKRCVLNRIQTNTIANVAGQTQLPMVIRLTASEVNDEPEYMLSPRAGLVVERHQKAHRDLMTAAVQAGQAGQDITGAAQQMDAILLSFTGEQIGAVNGKPLPDGPIEPLTEDQAEWVRALMDAGELRQRDLIQIDDRFVVECGQEIFDNRWDLSLGDRQVVFNEFLCNIFGHQPMRIQFHETGQKAGLFTLENTHVLNCWIDPSHDSIDEAAYFIHEHVLSADEAKATWPEWADKIDAARSSGELRVGRSGMSGGGGRSQIKFYRDMVRVRTTWLRYQPIPLSLDEALAEGSVIEELRRPAPGDEDIAGDMLNGDEPDMGAMLAGYVLADTGESVSEGDEHWPTRTGLLQVTTLPDLDLLVEQVECPYLDIPFAWNVNIPIPYSPYGQGEPQRLEDLQQQVNRLLSIFANYTMYYQFPQRYWKHSVLEKLQAMGTPLHSRPGAEIPIPDAEYDKLVSQGKMCITQEIAVMPPILMNMLELLLGEMDKLSGNVQIRQGTPPSNNMSGAALNTLREEAYGPLALRAKFTEWAVERTARIMMDMIVKKLDRATVGEILDRYSAAVIDRVMERLSSIRLDFRVEVSQGRGTNQEREEQRAMSMRAAGLLDRRSTMERVRIEDVDEVLRRLDAEAAQMAQSSVPVQAAATDNLGVAA